MEQTPKPSLASLLLAREKYEEASQKEEKLPIKKIEKNGQQLFYFGANHSSDPENAQYPVLQTVWQEFLEKTQQKPRIVLIEGGRRHLQVDEATAIKRGAEASFITLLAHRAGINVVSPDSTNEEINEALPDIPSKELLLYWFLSFTDNFRRGTKDQGSFDQAAAHWWEARKNRSQTQEISLEELKQLYKEVVGKEFNPNDHFNDLVNPNKTGTRINEIARAVSDLRDAKIVSEIERYWQEGNSLFVVFGRGHLIIQEAALDSLS